MQTTPKRPLFFFDRRDHALIEIVNAVIGEKDHTNSRRQFYPHFHATGIKELTESKGLRTAYATLHLLSSLAVGGSVDRINALRVLRKEVIETAEGPMPKNTARVLLQIMKTLVRCHGDHLRQLKLAHDFRATASGRPRIVRRQLEHYRLLEMPESWNQIAFDDHVHDANTKGRKSPTHLIMDAWIKGIRRLRVIHYHFVEPRFAAELLEAAAILGVEVRIGIEFYARYRDKYIQLIWAPRGFANAEGFLCFLAEPAVSKVMDAGKTVARYLQRHVLALFDRYNTVHRRHLEQRLGIRLAPLDRSAFVNFVGIGQMSTLHLAKFIHEQILQALRKKADRLRSAMDQADAETAKKMQSWIEKANGLDLEAIVDRMLSKAKNPTIVYPDHPSQTADEPARLHLTPYQMLAQLTRLSNNYRVTLNLSNVQVHEVLELLYDCRGMITRLELFNLKDDAQGKTDHIPAISRLQHDINQRNLIHLKRRIQTILDGYEKQYTRTGPHWGKLETILHDIDALASYYATAGLKSRIGSDSTGRSPKIHGMGLVVRNTLPRHVKRTIAHRDDGFWRTIPIYIPVLRTTLDLPKPLNRPFGALMRRLADRFAWLRPLGYRIQQGWKVQSDGIRMQPRGNVVTLGGAVKTIDNGLTRTDNGPVSRRTTSVRYLNTHLKNSLKVVIGFIPAFLTFALTKDWWVLAYLGAFIWFGITGLRNIIQSVLGGGGLRRSPLLDWNDLISWTRVADSLLYTGFSVPLLDYLVKTVLMDRWLHVTTANQPVVLYSCIALANGIYLSSHNAFRGLPKAAIYGNFFRSILSIPIAVAFNAAVAGLLSVAGVAGIDAILQKWAAIISKTASDAVAAMIEGTADRYANIRQRMRAYRNKFRELINVYAQLELCYPDVASGSILDQDTTGREKVCAEAYDLERIIMIHGLDMLYFWMYQPRAGVALRDFLRSCSLDERQIFISSQFVLTRHREVSQLFIDGILGERYPKALAFYLSRYNEYLDSVKQLVWTDDTPKAKEAAGGT